MSVPDRASGQATISNWAALAYMNYAEIFYHRGIFSVCRSNDVTCCVECPK